MRIVFLDDSVPFDAHTAGQKPLAGAQKAFAALAGIFARRDETVRVFNRLGHVSYSFGARWEKWGTPKPLDADAVIALRDPELFRPIRLARKRVLWVTQPAGHLLRTRTAQLLDELRPTLMFVSEAQARVWREGAAMAGSGLGDLPVAVVPPAAPPAYLEDAPNDPSDPPIAVCTLHPHHGLGRLLDLWVDGIRPKVEGARLRLISMVLHRARQGLEVDDPTAKLYERIKGLDDKGVEVLRPEGDRFLSQVYRNARVHLYPGQSVDWGCWTLVDSQARGLPAVVRDIGAAAERIEDGRTGFVAPDDDAFVNVAVQILTNQGTFDGLSASARDFAKANTWDGVADQVMALIKGTPTQQPPAPHPADADAHADEAP